MKKYIYSSFLLSILFFASCTEIDSKMLVGNWKVVEFDAEMPDLSPAIVEGAREKALTGRHIFEEDGSFSMWHSSNSSKVEGKYELISNGGKNFLKMIVDNSAAESESCELIYLKDQEMQWKIDFEGMGTTTLTLVKE